MLVLGIDIGTTSTKALLLSDQLEVVAEDSASYPLYFTSDGGVEQNPEDWWGACCSILRKFWSMGINSKEIGCITVSGHGASMVVMDSGGRILRPAISCLDTRCSPQTDKIRRLAGDLILSCNGNGVGAFNFEPKLLWLKEKERHHYDGMQCLLSATSYVNYRLTGVAAMNRSDGGIGMSYNRGVDDGWSPDIIRAIGLDREKFPPIMECSEIMGTLTLGAAAETGLPAGIPVLAGGEDTSSAALAVGVHLPGDAYLSLGTQGTVGVCTDRFGISTRILGFPHVLPGLSLMSGSMSTFGAGMQWFIRNWCRDLQLEEEKSHTPAIAALNEALKESSQGAKGLLFLPYLSGELHPILDEQAKGVFFGLKLEHTRTDMARAVLEGTAHAVKHNLDHAEEASGKVRELRAVGGPAQSPIWCQIIADVTRRMVTVVHVKGGSGGAPFGNALLALKKMKGYDIPEMLAHCIRVEREHSPNPQAADVYQRHHEVYRELYLRTKDLFPRLGGENAD